MPPKVAIIYLSYHSDPHLEDAVTAWRSLTYPHAQIEIVIVDNPHPEFGSSVRYIEEHVMPLSGREMPHITLLPQEKNTGFAGGNNVGILWSLAHDFDYIYLHNDDGFMVSGALEPIVGAMEHDATIGAAQSLLLLYPDTDRVNSAGNKFHYLGFGFCDGYRKKVTDLAVPAVSDVSYMSGAALLLRADLLRQYGPLDEDFFMYHEDLEYAFRIRMAGFRTVLVRDSQFYHKYQFGRSVQKFYWMERNRFGVLLMFFRLPTLILLAPMLILLEIGLWFFAFRGGWWRKRLAVYEYWMETDHWKLWLKKRQRIQRTRRISDRMLLSTASPTIQFQEAALENPILTYIGNPLMFVYYWVIVRGLVWW